MRLALFEPDIAQNTGTMLRLAACLGIAVDLIEPCGFVLDDARLRRSGMDYLDGVDLTRHACWDAFLSSRRDENARLVLLTTNAAGSYLDAAFKATDTILVGRESAGAPQHVHAAADLRLVIPMRPGMRSLNVSIAAAMALGEAMRQTRLMPGTRGR